MTIEVVAAIVIYKKKILVAQRKSSENPDLSLKYEFPGGKVENKESKLAALKRELFEELELEVKDIKYFYAYEFGFPEKIRLNFFTCKTQELNFKVKVHEKVNLIDVNKIKTLNWLKSNYKVVERIEKKYSQFSNNY